MSIHYNMVHWYILVRGFFSKDFISAFFSPEVLIPRFIHTSVVKKCISKTKIITPTKY